MVSPKLHAFYRLTESLLRPGLTNFQTIYQQNMLIFFNVKLPANSYQYYITIELSCVIHLFKGKRNDESENKLRLNTFAYLQRLPYTVAGYSIGHLIYLYVKHSRAYQI